ncbi:MAG: hypothetical protein C0402_02775 [Thermodesulfovibrio sp.]|nr:hypothetical protein [Thermodesulfovibrio sp.]
MHDDETKRTEIVENPKEIFARIQAAAAFKAAVAVRRGGFDFPLEGAFISAVTLDDSGHFLLKASPQAGLVDKDAVALRTSIYASFIDFTAERLAVYDQPDGTCGFRLPVTMRIHYARKHFRIEPSEGHPVKVRFQSGTLRGISPLVKVVDLSEGGLGIRVYDAESTFRVGDMIELMEVILPGEGAAVAVPVAGMVRYSCEDRCGLQFLRDERHDLSRISQYVSRLKMIDNVHKKTYRSTSELEKGLQFESEKRHKILIVDDSMAVHEKYKQAFSANFEVLQAFDGLEGIKKAMESLPDLVLMDVNMPKMNGLECTRVIKSQASTRHIPICMFTSEGDQEAVVKALKFGVKDYIVKTMDAKFVVERIQSILMGS